MKNTLIGIVVLAVIVAAAVLWRKPAQAPQLDASFTGVAATSSVAYTLSEISSHASGQSCWAAVSGKVYDLTPWIEAHPGGSEAILSICGKDGTQAFESQHGGQRRPEAELSRFVIGTLVR